MKSNVMVFLMFLCVSVVFAEENITMSEKDGDICTEEESQNEVEVSDEALRTTTHYYSVGGEAFVPGRNVGYRNTYGMGGAYYTEEISGALVTHVHLPHNAVVTEFKAYFYDDSTKNLSVSLKGLRLNGGSNWLLASVDSPGVTEYGSAVDTTISSSTINNTFFGYKIYVYCSPWDPSGDLRIMGAVITYTTAD